MFPQEEVGVQIPAHLLRSPIRTEIPAIFAGDLMQLSRVHKTIRGMPVLHVTAGRTTLLKVLQARWRLFQREATRGHNLQYLNEAHRTIQRQLEDART